MNHSTSADAYVPSMLSFVDMDDTGGANNQKHHQLIRGCWEYSNSHPTSNPIAATNNSNPYVVTAANPFLDCQPSLLPATNLPFYSPVVPDLHHHRHHERYPGLIKVEDCSGMASYGQICLNLGHRTYFPSGDSLAIDRLFRRSRGMYHLTQQGPRCQADGCKADLSGAKHYHRRHKVCEFHSKATVVVSGGLQQRFCQQCSRFHVLSEFDEAKRSCRKKLADHNRRRRKQQTTRDSSAPNNSATSCSTEETNKHAAQENARKICTPSAGAIFTTAATFSTFSTSSMSADSQSNNKKVSPFGGAPALSLWGEEDGGAGGEEGFGIHSSSYHPCSNNVDPAFAVMSKDDSPHLQHVMSSSSSAATFYHPPPPRSTTHRRDFFCPNTSVGASQSTPHGR